MRRNRSNLRFFEDMARVASGAVGSLSEVRGQLRDFVGDCVNRIMDETDMVTREEFERVEAMAEKARLRQEELEERLATLEGKKKKKTTVKRKAKKTVKGKKK